MLATQRSIRSPAAQQLPSTDPATPLPLAIRRDRVQPLLRMLCASTPADDVEGFTAALQVQSEQLTIDWAS